MTLSSINLVQQLSANVASSGIQSSIPVGGTNTTTVTSSTADIVYGFTMKSGNAANKVTLNLATSTLKHYDGSANETITCSESIGAHGGSGDTILDATGTAVSGTVANIVALYYEVPSGNGDAIVVTGSASMGSITFGATNASSALFIPQAAASGTTVVFDFGGDDDTIKVLCLAKD